MPGRGLIFNHDNTTQLTPEQQLHNANQSVLEAQHAAPAEAAPEVHARISGRDEGTTPQSWFMLQSHSVKRDQCIRISVHKEKRGLLSHSLVMSSNSRLDGLPEAEVRPPWIRPL